MLARIVDNNWVYLYQLTTYMESVISKRFSVKHPRARYIDSNWDGVYRKYDSRNQRLRKPLLKELIKLCKETNIPIDIQDARSHVLYPSPDSSIVDENWLSGITLEDYQVEAIRTACVEDEGIFYFITGSGKTEIAAGIIKLFDCPAVVLADKRIVIEQIKSRLELRDVVDDGVGLFYGGETPEGQLVIVGSIQSLSSPPLSYKKKNLSVYEKKKKRAEHFQRIVRKADLLLVDECDICTGGNWSKVFYEWFKGRRKYGFTGTLPDRTKPVERLLLKERLGEVISSSDRQTLVDKGRIIPVELISIVLGENGNRNEKVAFDIAEKELIVENEDFHNIIKKIVDGSSGKTLIIVDTNNIESLGRSLEDKIDDAVFIYGKTSKTKRREIISSFEDGSLKCLIGSKIVKRGLDLKGGVDNLIICGGGKGWADLNQKIGRAVRLNDKGWARIYTFFNMNNHYLYRHSKERLLAMLDMGYDPRMIFNGGEILGSKFVRSNYRKPKFK